MVTQSETSDDAIKRFDADIRLLQKLDIARNYVELLAHVEDLRYAESLNGGDRCLTMNKQRGAKQLQILSTGGTTAIPSTTKAFNCAEGRSRCS